MMSNAYAELLQMPEMNIGITNFSQTLLTFT